jgi:hypothetical protein
MIRFAAHIHELRYGMDDANNGLATSMKKITNSYIRH